MNRFDCVPWDQAAARQHGEAKEGCKILEEMIDKLPKGRAQSLAITKLEECYMWIGKAIRDDQFERNGSKDG